MNLLLETALANAAVATALALLAFVVDRLARRPALGHCLWMLVLLKLLTPPLWTVPVPGWPGEAPKDATVLAVGEVPELDERAPPVEPIAECPLAVPRRSAFGRSLPSVPALAPTIGPDAEPPPPPVSAATVILGVWAAGSLLWFLAAGVRIVRFQRLLRHAEPAPEEIQAQAWGLAETLDLATCPRVWLVPVSVSPLLWAVGGPARLVLPTKLLGRLKPEERDALLAHELAHFRRHDHWVRWLELIAVGLYWWHPAAWWARRELGRAEERCCDAWVVWSLPGAALSYARALLKTVDFLSEAGPSMPPAASGAGHVHSLRRRVTMILREPLQHRLSWPARLAALGLALLVLPLAPQRLRAQDADDRPNDSTRDLDRRLNDLEKKLDRLADSLKATRSESGGDEAGADRREAEAKRRAEDSRGRARERAEQAEPRARERAEQARRRAEEARHRAEQKADEARRRTDEKKRTFEEDMKGRTRDLDARIETLVKAGIDPKRMEQMGKRIEKAVKVGIDPKRMEQMGKRIEELFKDGIDPGRMEKLGKEIEKIVEESIDTEKIEEMAKEIEKAVEESIDTKKIEEMTREIEKAVKDASEGSKAEGSKRNKVEVETRVERSRDGDRRPEGDVRELEARMKRLEEKLDRVLGASKDSGRR